MESQILKTKQNVQAADDNADEASAGWCGKVVHPRAWGPQTGRSSRGYGGARWAARSRLLPEAPPVIIPPDAKKDSGPFCDIR